MNLLLRIKYILSTETFSNSFTVAAITSWKWFPLLGELSELCQIFVPPVALLTAVIICVIKIQTLRGFRQQDEE